MSVSYGGGSDVCHSQTPIVTPIANNNLYRENVTLSKSYDSVSEEGLPNATIRPVEFTSIPGGN